MEVVITVQQPMDFDFNKARSSSPYLSAPSTPRRFGEYYHSAPTSPRHLSAFYRDFNDFLTFEGSSSTVPFDWEEKPGTPKSSKINNTNKYEADFAFDVSEEMERTSLSADELFDGGVIRPLKPPPRLQHLTGEDNYSAQKSPAMSPRSHKSPISGAFSPRQQKEHERGRDRVATLSSSRSRHRVTRSLSPLRVSEYPWEEEEHQLLPNTKESPMESKPSLTSTTSTLSSSSSKGSRKWRLKDFFLFRSASEGRATDKYPLKKYRSLFKRHEDVKHSSFRSTDNSGSGSGSRRKGPISAHELHYTMNRAVSEDLKKKTFLPYKQGILGRLAFNPAVHAIANGFGFSRR